MTSSVPQSEAEVFEQYYPHIKFLVARAGIRKDYVEDYAMALMIKFLEKGVLNHYNPEHISEVDGVKRTANFKTFLSGFVNSYLRYLAHRDAINASRSYFSSDMRISTSGDESGIPLLDFLGITVDDDTDRVEANEIIQNVRKSLAGKGERNLLFFEVVLLQVEEYGKVNVGELAEMFEVTRSSIHNWLKKLRQEFAECQ